MSRVSVFVEASSGVGSVGITGIGGARPGHWSKGGPGSCGHGSIPSGTGTGAGSVQNGSLLRRYSAKSAASTSSKQTASTRPGSSGLPRAPGHKSGTSPVASCSLSKRDHNRTTSSGNSSESHMCTRPQGRNRPGGNPSGSARTMAAL
jgi:hypothetical protein